MITEEMCPIRTEILTQTFGKMYLFVICMISRHWFQTKLILYSIYTSGGMMFYRQKSKGWGDDVLYTKYQRGAGLLHTKYVIANGKLRQSSTF